MVSVKFGFSSKAFARLMDRCLYFCALVSFYSGCINDPLVIEIPEQPYLTESDCFLLIVIFSKVTISYDKLRGFSLESLIFFASYFNCEFLLDYLLNTMWENKKRVLSVLRLGKYFFGLRDSFTRAAISSVSNYLNQSNNEYVINILCLGEDGPHCAMRALSKKLRDTARIRRLLFSQFQIACVHCKTSIKFNYKGATFDKVVFLKCCLRPIHVSYCFETLISCSYDRNSNCPFCRSVWIKGQPIIDNINRGACLQEYFYSLEDYPHHVKKLHSDTLFK